MFYLQPIVKEVSDYHSKLKSVTPPPVDMAAVKASQVPPTDVCPIVEQAAASKRQWDWILKQSIEQLDTVKELADRVEEFEGKQKALKDFIEEGKALLEKEKPVSENSARLKEQLDTCKVCRNDGGRFRLDLGALSKPLHTYPSVCRGVTHSGTPLIQTPELWAPL